MTIERVVLDTSVFVNPEVRVYLGRTPAEAMNAFAEYAGRMPTHEFYMPPSIYEELMNFVGRAELTGEFLRHVRQKAPSRYEMQVPGLFLYELVEELRDRVNKGLRAAEGAIRSGAPLDDRIRELRRKYREALREGVIDSKEDVDLILLARELGALLVTADQGAAHWADKLGVRWLLPEKFREYLEACALKAAGPPGSE